MESIPEMMFPRHVRKIVHNSSPSCPSSLQLRKLNKKLKFFMNDLLELARIQKFRRKAALTFLVETNGYFVVNVRILNRD